MGWRVRAVPASGIKVLNVQAGRPCFGVRAHRSKMRPERSQDRRCCNRPDLQGAPESGREAGSPPLLGRSIVWLSWIAARVGGRNRYNKPHGSRPCELIGTNSKPWQPVLLLQWLAKMRESGSPWVRRLHHSRPGAQDAKTAIEPASLFRGRRLCTLAPTVGCRLLIRSGCCARANVCGLGGRLTMNGSIRPTENPMSKLSGIGTKRNSGRLKTFGPIIASRARVEGDPRLVY
jgi:hypothetical protein